MAPGKDWAWRSVQKSGLSGAALRGSSVARWRALRRALAQANGGQRAPPHLVSADPGIAFAERNDARGSPPGTCYVIEPAREHLAFAKTVLRRERLQGRVRAVRARAQSGQAPGGLAAAASTASWCAQAAAWQCPVPRRLLADSARSRPSLAARL
ncbi:MAG: hypothetical protein ABIR56_11255 [Polaromonas sp.]